MNGSMGTEVLAGAGGEIFFKMDEWNKSQRPGWIVFMDTHDDSIATCNLTLARDATFSGWSKFPTARHGKAGTQGFVDGHLEMKRWVDSRTLARVTGGSTPPQNHFGGPDYHYVYLRFGNLQPI